MIFQRVIGFLLTAGLLTGSLVCYGQQNKRYKAEKGKQSQSKPVQSESGQTVTDDYQLKGTPQGSGCCWQAPAGGGRAWWYPSLSSCRGA